MTFVYCAIFSILYIDIQFTPPVEISRIQNIIKLKIKWKILLVLLFLVITAIGATNILWINSMNRDLKERIIDTQERLAKNAHLSLDDFVQAKLRNLILRSQTTAFVEKDITAAKREMLILLNQDSDLREVSFIDIDGRELIKVTPEKIFSDSDLVNQRLNPKFIIPTFRHGAEYMGDVYYSEHDEPILTISVPIIVPRIRYHLEEISTAQQGVLQRNPGDILGVLSAEVSLEDMIRIRENFNIGENGYLYIVNQDNQLISYPDRSLFQGGRDFSDIEIIKEHTLRDIALREKTGGHPYEHIFTGEFLSEKKERVLATYHHVPTLGWGLIVQQPVSEVFEPTRTVIKFAAILFLGGIFGTIVLSFWFSSILTRPIKLLGEGVRTIAKGNYDYKINMHTNDEMQDLANAFNEMTISVKSAIEKEKYLESIKRDFVSVAAHQLRTPLSAIKWAIAMLSEKNSNKFTKDQNDLLEKAAISNNKMIDLIDDLLNVAKIEEGKFVYNPKDVDIIDLMQKILESKKDELKNRNTKIKFESQPAGERPKVFCDGEKIQLAILNIIENAMRYTMPGGSIAVSVREEGNNVKISVKDDGIGIPSDQQRLLFTKFFRGRNAIKHQTSGSGLGLFIVKNIIEAHGGRVLFESVENKGTTFLISLPVNFKSQ